MIGIAICDDHTDYDVGNEIINTILNYYLSPIKSACKITVRRKNEPFAENSKHIGGRWDKLVAFLLCF